MKNDGFKVLESHKHGISWIELWENGIIYIKTDDHSETSLEDSIYQHNFLKSKFDGKNKLKLLVEPGKFSGITKEAREFSTKPESNAMTMASAVVIKSLAQRILINFIINMVQKQNMKMKMFDSKEKAIEWLLALK